MQRTKRHARDSSPRGVFITATDTGVGKTLVASALVTCLTQRGIDVGVMKPIETGVSQSHKLQSDGARLRKAAGTRDPLEKCAPMSFDFQWRHFLLHERKGKLCRWQRSYEPSAPCVRSILSWW